MRTLRTYQALKDENDRLQSEISKLKEEVQENNTERMKKVKVNDRLQSEISKLKEEVQENSIERMKKLEDELDVSKAMNEVIQVLKGLYTSVWDMLKNPKDLKEGSESFCEDHEGTLENESW